MSLGSGSNTYLSELISVGADAMTNLYKVEFSGGLLDGEYSDLPVALKVRNKDFTPPTFSQDQKNTVHYMTTSVDLPKSVVSGTKELTFKFRLDSNYRVYSFLLKQQSATGMANLGFATNGVPDSVDGGFKVAVYAFDRSLSNDIEALADPTEDDCYRKMYEFRHCWIKKLSGLDYSYDNSNPEVLTVTVGFFDFDDPMNLLIS